MMEYYDQGNFEPWEKLSQPETHEYARQKARTLTLIESEFDPDTREGQQGLAEALIYKTFSNTLCLTEEFLNKHRYRKPEKIEFLQCMLDSRAGLFEVTSTDREEGYVYYKDVFTGSEHKITDTSMSAAPDQSINAYIYTRIISYRGISFSTGLSLMFSKTDPFIQGFIEREQRGFDPNQEFRRFIELYNQFSRNPKKYKVVPHSF
jgi:hypothetical protein